MVALDPPISEVTFNNRLFTLVIQEQELNITLPEEFARATAIHYKQINNDILLVSANVSSIGLWRYKFSTNNWKQLYTSGGNWRYFNQINENKWHISAEELNMDHVSGYGILLYNIEIDKTILIYNTNDQWMHYYNVFENKWLIGGETNSGVKVGLLLYNSNDDSVTKIFSACYNISVFQSIGTKCLCGSNSSNSGSGKILLYNYIDDSCIDIGVSNNITGNKFVYYYVLNDNECLIANSYNNNAPLLLYDNTNDSLIEIYSNGYYLNTFNIIGNKCLMCCSSSYRRGIYVYDIEQKTVTELISTNYVYHFQNVGNTKCLIGSKSYFNGIYLYKTTDNSLTQIITGIYVGKFFKINDTRYLACSQSSSNNGICSYNETDDSVEKIYTTGYNWIYGEVFNNKCLLSSSENNGLLLYKASDNAISQIYTIGYNYNTFVKDGVNYYISSSDKSKNRLVVYYEDSTETITLSKYYIGEV